MARNSKADARAEASRIATAAHGLPVVVLVGRANVGKSTLFNRIVRRGRAIVSPIAGTTRDLNIARAAYEDRDFVVIDSGGLELCRARADDGARRGRGLARGGRGGRRGVRDGWARGTRERRPRSARADSRNRASDDRRGQQNRSPEHEAAAADAYSLGVPSVTFVSAAHGLGVGELLDAIVAQLPAREATPEALPDLRLALIGRPNVGKSSLLNRLSGFDRAIVDDRPGTTRDPVDVRLNVGGSRRSADRHRGNSAADQG